MKRLNKPCENYYKQKENGQSPSRIRKKGRLKDRNQGIHKQQTISQTIKDILKIIHLRINTPNAEIMIDLCLFDTYLILFSNLHEKYNINFIL